MRRNMITAGVIAAGLVLAGCGAAQPRVENTASTNQVQGCEPSMVTSNPDGRNGIALFVNSPGPDRIEVTVVDAMVRYHRLFQQVTKRDSGATFDFPGINDGPVAAVVNSDQRGVCLMTNLAIG